ncbi:tRNA uridine-5-carboxymethylaminomethyl(34) synthesis GTPase MnmE [Ancylobacter terrae]|uniref:tRNA uridine-5-carboxymethylaminomethyl(34) synthesis GTPase MnmE n=1 Tax=Ancylobacter sp. sgz301288 TaxID=3342077 RepID=UPI00385E44F4
MSTDTIAAVSSGSGRAAVAVIRLSGPQAGAAMEALAGGLPPPRRASLRSLVDPADGDVLDRALVLWLPGPGSATGEDMAEFQVHGGRAVVAAVLEALRRVPGLRLAEAGEFTRRAFRNGRMDLTEVEGLADLLAADTEGQRRLALAHAFGHLGQRVERWRGRLVRAMALLEAGIDFADEDDVPAETRAAARPEIAALRAELGAALDDPRGAAVRAGFTVALAGLPNAGKSSLINALTARDVAIVSEEPGTTRDALEVALDLGGQKVTLVDTAGLREAESRIEAEGIRRARARIGAADLVLWVHDSGEGAPPREAPANGGSAEAPFWLLSNKSDVTEPLTGPNPAWAAAAFRVSAARGDGIDALLAALSAWAADRGGRGEHPALVRARHREAVAAVAAGLDGVLAQWDDLPDELLAEELRAAAAGLGRVTGRIGVEDLLDVVFREFCIGK